MTINNAANKVIALGNGVTTQFGFSFVGDQPGYISVIFTNSAGVNTTLTQGPGPTQYQLSLNPPVSPGLWGIGGTVTYNPGGTPIPSGTTLTIIRELPFLQDVSLLDLASLAAVSRAAESGLDQEEMQIQQLAENLARVVAGPVSDPAGINYILPPVAQRANTGLLFDSLGNIIAGTTPATGIISTAMQPVVDAASLALGRSAFGLGSMAVQNTTSYMLSVQNSPFNAVGDGVTDDSAAVLAALAALPSEGGAIYFPPGKYLLNSQIAYTLTAAFASISFIGSGQNSTILYFPNANTGVQVNYGDPTNSAHFRDLTITTGTTNAGNGIALFQSVALGAWAISDIENVTIRGDDNIAVYYFTNAISIVGVSGVNIDSVLIESDSTGTNGIGIFYLGLTAFSPFYAVVENVSKTTFNSVGSGISYGSYIQGITVSQCNFTNGGIGIGVPAGQTGTLGQLAVSDSQFDVITNPIQLLTQVSAVQLTNNTVFVRSGYSGFALGTAQLVALTGNQFAARTPGTGTGISGNANFVTATGNLFNQLLIGIDQGASGGFAAYSANVFQDNGTGIEIEGGSAMISGNNFNGNTLAINVPTPATTPVNIQSNQYTNNTTNISPAASTGDVVVGGGSA